MLREFSSTPKEKFKYQGSEEDEEVGEGMYNTFYRKLDTDIARWTSKDPKPVHFESPYASMACNPIRYNDIQGDSIPFRINRRLRKEMGISRKEAKSITPEKVSRLFQQEYGIKIEARNGWLHYAGESSIQPTIVSKSAKEIWTRMLGNQIRSSQKLIFVSNSKGIDGGAHGGKKSFIDLSDYNQDFSLIGTNYNGVPIRTMNMGRIMEHEYIGHGLNSLEDAYFDRKFNPATMPGETVDLINTFRKEMNLPIRMNYSQSLDKNIGGIKFKFNNGSIKMVTW